MFRYRVCHVWVVSGYLARLKGCTRGGLFRGACFGFWCLLKFVPRVMPVRSDVVSFVHRDGRSCFFPFVFVFAMVCFRCVVCPRWCVFAALCARDGVFSRRCVLAMVCFHGVVCSRWCVVTALCARDDVCSFVVCMHGVETCCVWCKLLCVCLL